LHRIPWLFLQYAYIKFETHLSATTVGSGQSKQSGQAVEAESPKAEVAGDVLLPSVPKDFELFLNLVEFSKLILPTNHSKLFSRWIYILARELIIKANQYPLVSGFYKLLSIALKIAEKLKYFRGAEPGAKPDVSHADVRTPSQFVELISN
jgi:DNA-dependent protein kinase catalytic subunit